MQANSGSSRSQATTKMPVSKNRNNNKKKKRDFLKGQDVMIISESTYSFTYIIYLKVHEFKVEMTCSGCSGAVERVLGKLGGKEIINYTNSFIEL